MSAPHFWHEHAREYVQILGIFDGPRQWAVHVQGSSRDWRTHPAFLRPFNNGDECWEWASTMHSAGYGTVWIDGKHHRAHRVAWALAAGEKIGSTKIFVCHRCDNRRCVRPDLFLGTAADNAADMARKGRANRMKRDEHPNAKLSSDQLAALKEAFRSGRHREPLSAEFGISAGQVTSLCRGLRKGKVSRPPRRFNAACAFCRGVFQTSRSHARYCSPICCERSRRARLAGQAVSP